MSVEEIRMNKGLLKEISKMKKQSQINDYSQMDEGSMPSPDVGNKKASELNAY